MTSADSPPGSREPYPAFSVLMPVYHGNTRLELTEAIRSALAQTVPPDEIVFVEDGPLTQELYDALDSVQSEYPEAVSRHRLETNAGSGIARRVGIERCEHDLVALMDADDVSVRDRFERQLTLLRERPEVDVVGGFIGEFESDPEDVYALRIVPTTHDEIVARASRQNPVNQTTVMARRQTIIDAGNYRRFPGVEDYDLWVRMMADGARFANIPSVLARARIDPQYTRRGGPTLAKAELRLQLEFYRTGFISVPTLLYNLLTRVSVQLLPRRIRGRLIARYTRTPL